MQLSAQENLVHEVPMYGKNNSNEDWLHAAIDLLDAGGTLVDAARDEPDAWLRDQMLDGASECVSFARMLVVETRRRVSEKVSDANKLTDDARRA